MTPDRPLVLVVDDNADACRVLRRRLRLVGFAVDCATSGANALAYLTNRRPAMMILDISMPHMDGIEVLRRVRADPRTA